jgi:Terpene cyclase DEP1
MQWRYLILAIIGAVLPYSQFLPWLADHGLNLSLLLRELFSTRAGAFFGMDVLVSAVVLITFILHEGAVRKIQRLWLPIAATCLVGVSCGLPLFLYLRERQLAKNAPV